MEERSVVNEQITDAVTQTNLKVLSEAPAMALGSLYQSMSNALSMSSANLVYSQQQMNTTMQATITSSVQSILGVNEKHKKE
jgi:hypothetical protein